MVIESLRPTHSVLSVLPSGPLRHIPVLLIVLSILAATCETVAGPQNDSSTPGRSDSTLVPPKNDAAFTVVGYHPWWLASAWASYDLSLLDRIYFFEIEVGANGRLTDRNGWPFLWSEMNETAVRSNVGVSPTVTILDSQTYISLFSDSTAVSTLFTELTALASSGMVSGLHLDIEAFEQTPPELRGIFSTFVEDLSRELHARRPDFSLSLFLLALDASDNYDEARLAAAVDYVVVQGYDLHWLGDDEAGPVASLTGWGDRNWHDIVEKMISSGIPRSKILMAVPYYGYEWPTTGPEPGSSTTGPGSLLPYAPVLDGFSSARDQAVKNGLLRDTQSDSPYYTFQDSTGWHQGWFEDARSLASKYAFVLDEGLAGIAIFPFGYGDPTLNEILRSARLGLSPIPIPGTN